MNPHFSKWSEPKKKSYRDNMTTEGGVGHCGGIPLPLASALHLLDGVVLIPFIE